MASPKVVVVGSCNTDLISYTPRLPKPGETINGHRFSIGFGGKGANQCVAAARLGAKTAMVAMVGNDSFGRDFIQNFRDNGVDVSHIGVTNEAATGVAPIIVNDEGENSIIVVQGANLKMTSSKVEESEEAIEKCSVLVCQGEITMEATLAALKMARKHNVKTLMNAAPADAGLDPAVIKNSDIFCVNESEAEVFTKVGVKTVQDAQHAAKILLSKGCSSVLITLGAAGALYSTSSENIHVPAYEVTPVDTTGAGDAFVGAMAYYLAYHPQLTMEEMMQRSCKVASISVQAPGTQSSYPTKENLPSYLFI